ncbi:MAG: hypothetical protein R3D25_16725 [Geminicoccaceae bacterium]
MAPSEPSGAAREPLMGRPVRRKEDQRFVTGTGRYVADIALPRETVGVVVRSDHAHAEIRAIETAAAAAMPGVLAVYTGRDLEAAGIGTLPCGWMVQSKDGTPMAQPPHPVLAQGRVRHVGDPVAFVVAETRAAALAAAGRVAVEYAPLPNVTDLATAVTPKRRCSGQAPGNLCYDWEVGDAAAVDAAFRDAHHVTTVALVNNHASTPRPWRRAARSATGTPAPDG